MMTSIRGRLVAACLVGIFLLAGSPVSAQSASGSRSEAERRLVLAADEGKDGAIDADELAEFLVSRLQPVYADIAKVYTDRGLTPPYRLAVPVVDEGGIEQPIPDAAPGDTRLSLDAAMRQFVNRIPLEMRVSSKLVFRGAQVAKLAEVDLPIPFHGTIGSLVGVGSAPATNAALAKQPTPSTVDWLDSWLSIRRSFLDARDIGRPATLTWTHYGNSDDRSATSDSTRLEVDGALTFEPHAFDLPTVDLGGAWLDWNLVGVYEAHTSTVATANRSRITHRIGLQAVVAAKEYTDLWSAHNLDVTFDYITDEDYRADVIGGTLQYTPSIHRLGIGRAVEFTPDLEVRWRPYVGLTHARVNDPGVSPQFRDFVGYTDVFLRAAVEFKWRDRLRIVPELAYFQELEDEQHGHVLAGIAGRLSLDDDDRVSLEVSWSRGEQFPSRSDVSEVQIALGLKF